ncbi:MAG TPA: carbohydrate binding domain-containing protein [Bryobacteraceae bacterium]|nr:carbohydrate binding domain-containing protein [Bryobacteraceae bacterium]
MSAAVAAWLLMPVGAQSTNTITLNRGIRYQTLRGWEATAYAGQDHPAFANFRNVVFDEAAYDLRLTRLRVEVRSGTENSQDFWTQYRNGQISYQLWRCVRYSTVNDNGDPFTINWAGFQFSDLDDTIERVVLPLQQRLLAQGQRLEINLNYVAFTKEMTATGCPSGLSYVHDDSPEEYAEFVLATYLHLQGKYGWVPDYWEVILEPDNTPYWRGTQIGRAIAAAAARLRAYGFKPRFIAPSTTDMGHAWMYFDAMITVPGVTGSLVELAYHRYGGVTLSNLQAIAARARQYGIGAAMLEHIGSGYQDLHQDLKVGNNVAWQQFTLASVGADSGGSYYVVDASNPSRPTVRLGSRTRYLRQYFRYIRPGAVRIEAATTNPAFDPVAFLAPDGSETVVVSAAGGGSFVISGLGGGTYGVRYTTDGLYDMDAGDRTIAAGQSLSVSMPSAGVVTVYRKFSSGSSSPSPSPQPQPTPTPSPAPANLLADPGFENGGLGWQSVNNGGRSVVTTQAHSGLRSQQILVSSQWGRQVYQDVPVIPGRRYAASAWVKTSQVGGDGAAVMLQWLTATGLAPDLPAGSVIRTDWVGRLQGTWDWRKVEIEVTAPAGARAVRFRLYTTPDPDNSGAAWFDDTLLQ